MVKDEYLGIAKNYDTVWSHYTHITLDEIRKYLPSNLDSFNILDYGCGTGEFIIKALMNFNNINKIVGFDPSLTMLEIAANKLSNMDDTYKITLTSEASDIASLNQKFDLIVCSNVFHYFKNPQNELKKFKDLITDDGLIILLDYSKSSFFAHYFEWLIKIYDTLHIKAYSKNQAEEQLNLSGLKILESKKFRVSFLWKCWIFKTTK